MSRTELTPSARDRALDIRLKRIHRKIAKGEEEITEVGRPFSVRFRARPEAVCEGQSSCFVRFPAVEAVASGIKEKLSQQS